MSAAARKAASARMKAYWAKRKGAAKAKAARRARSKERSEVPTLKVMRASGTLRELPLYDSAKPLKRKAVVYMVKTLADGVRLAFNRES